MLVLWREHVPENSEFLLFVSFRCVVCGSSNMVHGENSTFDSPVAQSIDGGVMTCGVAGASNCERTLRVHVHLTSERGGVG